MHSTMKGFAAALATTLFTVASAQTYSSCNPMKQSCGADPALGGTSVADFSKGASSQYTSQGASSRISYGKNGVGLSVVSQGDSPTLQSNFYFMFGRVDVVMQAAPGTGIVSSIVMESDDLDEVDWEFLGGDTTQVQSNYFGKGDTSSYNRGAFHPVSPAPQGSFQTYSVVWTSASISWIINGNTVRTLTAEQGGYNYPQTPMRLKIGIWAGGDPNNSQGTIQWAGGQTTYGSGPFTMYVKSATVQDYSTGKSYSYGDQSGNWGSIRSDGGSIYGGANPPNGGTPTQPQPGSAITIPASKAEPLTPFQSTFMTIPKSNPVHTGWPWVATHPHETPTDHSTRSYSAPSGSPTSLPAGKKPVDEDVSITASPTSSPTTMAVAQAAATAGSKSSASSNRVVVLHNSVIAITLIIGLICIF